MTGGVERSGILPLFGRRSKSRLGPGKIDTSISKQRTFEMLLRQAKILSAHFGQRSITASTISLCGCVCGKPRIIGLRYEGWRAIGRDESPNPPFFGRSAFPALTM